MIFYLDKRQPKGTIIIECGKMLSDAGYKIKVLNTINFKKSMRYNPFHYIRSEKDILKLVNTICVPEIPSSVKWMQLVKPCCSA